jgi:hypothetical protein
LIMARHLTGSHQEAQKAQKRTGDCACHASCASVRAFQRSF